MYGIVHENSVILTQPNWNTRMFSSVLAEECGIERRMLASEESLVPLVLSANTKILKIVDNKPEYNSKIEWLDGPNYVVEDFQITSNYVVKLLDLNIAKGNLIDQLPALRYEKEKKNISLTIQETNLNISTDRETRAIFTNKLLAIGDGNINFKFKEGWFNLSKSDLEYIVQQIDAAVQEAFDWELSKMNEINACTSHEQLNQLQLVRPEKPYMGV